MTHTQEAAIARQCDHENLIGQLRTALTDALTAAGVVRNDGSLRDVLIARASAVLAKAEKC